MLFRSNEDLETLALTLQSLGVEVIRPDPLNFQVHDGLYNYCPRDRLLIAGNTVVDVSMMYPCRNQESRTLRKITEDAKIVEMPKDTGMILDAANICRLNDTWLFLESFSGNRLAYDWLCNQFPNITIELCNFYAEIGRAHV